MMTLRPPGFRREVLECPVVLSYWLTSSALLVILFGSGRAEPTISGQPAASSNSRLDELNETIGSQSSNSISKAEAEAPYFNGYQFQEEHPFFASNTQNSSNNIGKTPNRFEQLNSFYSFGEPTFDEDQNDRHLGRGRSQNQQSSRDNHIQGLVLRDEPIESVLLQSYGLELAPESEFQPRAPRLGRPDVSGRQIASVAASHANDLAAKRVELSRMTQQVIDAQHQKQLQLEQASRSARLRQLHSQQQPNSTFAQSQQQQEPILPKFIAEAQRSESLPPPPPPPSALNAVYRPSILGRTRPAFFESINQPSTSNQLQQQAAAQEQPRQRTIAKETGQHSPVSIDEIEDLLQRLKPLALKDFEKVSSSSEDSDDSSTSEQEDDDSDEPGESKEAALSGKSSTSGQAPRSSSSSQDSNEILLDSLANLGSRLKHSTESFVQPLEIGSNELAASGNAASSKSTDQATSSHQTVREQRNGSSGRRDSRNLFGRELDSSSGNAIQSIPIDLLVDHLMSSSRLMRSRQNNNDDELGEDQMGEDDDEDEYDEQTSGSNLNLTKVAASIGKKTFNESVVLNNTASSWVPIARVNAGANNGDQTVAITPNQNQTRPRSLDGGQAASKRSRSKRRSGSEMNLVIGGKQLSRTELIKLIKILNKMASKREPGKEREASRKLLRFLVKLAFDEYKRTKSPETGAEDQAKNTPTTASKKKRSGEKDSVEDLLRSILMSPVDKSRSGDDTSSTKSKQFLGKGDRGETEDPKESVDDDDGHDERVYQDNRNDDERTDSEKNVGKQKEGVDKLGTMDEENNKKPNNLRFNELAEDMEQYFDSDFFEDLADKVVPGNSSTAAASEKNRVKFTPKRRRSSRQGYNLPTPVQYNNRQKAGNNNYDADDDYEGDIERYVPSPSRDRGRRPNSKAGRKRLKPKRRNNSSSSPRTGRSFVESRIPARGGESRQRRRRLQRPPRERYNEEKGNGRSHRGRDDGDDRDDAEERRPERSSSRRRRMQRRRPQRRRSNANQRKGKATRKSAEDTTSGGDGQENEEDVDGGIEGEDEQKAQQDDGRDSGNDTNSGPSGDDGQEDLAGGPGGRRNEKSGDPIRSHRRRKRKKKRNANRTPQNRKELRRGEIDLDSRDEIPAPIEKGRSSIVELQPSPASNFTANKTDKANMMKADYAAIKLEPFSNKTSFRPSVMSTTATATVASASEPRKVGRIVLGIAGSNHAKVTTRPSRGGEVWEAPNEEVDQDEPVGDDIAREGEDNGEYYNEGTSYSKICDDDGKCKVTVQSSSPKLNKAIEAGDKPTIDKQLGKWIAEEPPD